MSRSRLTTIIAGLSTVLLFGLILTFVGSNNQKTTAAPKQEPVRPGAPTPPVTMSENLVTLQLNLGLTDKKSTPWGGSITVSQGRVLGSEISRGGNRATASGNTWRTNSVRQGNRGPFRAGVRVRLEAPDTAEVKIETRQGKFSFPLSDVQMRKTFLKGRVAVTQQIGALRLTGKQTEDDFPALARGKDGTIWLAYVEYQPSKPYVLERVLQQGDFDQLVPKGHGDRIRLRRFDGKTWHSALDVTEGGRDVWRPSVTVDGEGVVHVAWAETADGDWEIYSRRYTPPKKGDKGTWHTPVRVTKAKGSDFHVVVSTDASGVVWAAWQAWRKDNFDILMARLGEKPSEPRTISNSKANDWSPTIASDSQGHVYVAWDTHDKSNYDVHLRRFGKAEKTWHVARSARYEARPSLVCDKDDRVWIAYEEGDEQWGKDYATGPQGVKKIGIKRENPGFGLYIKRTIAVKCLQGDSLKQAAVPLQQGLGKRLQRNKSVPRLVTDAKGGLWLFFRHHPQANGGGEVWQSFAVRSNGKGWGRVFPLPDSRNLMDNRPAVLPYKQGILVVFSGDARRNTRNRQQDDLFAVTLSVRVSGALEMKDDEDPPAAKLKDVHPNEAADVARMRTARIKTGGKSLRLLRGEFHRHTEYTAHRDQDGLLEDSWRYALDAGNLDWMGNGDHDNGFHHEYMWWQIQKITDLYHNPPHFVAAQTHERSNRYPNGHRNVMMPRRGIRPLPRGELTKGSTPKKGTPDTKILYRYLKHFGGICASHTSGTNMGTDWRDSDPVVEPIVEIYQGHRHSYEHFGAPRSATAKTHIGGYQAAGTIWKAFEKGIRFGFQSSSDHVSTHMSYAIALTEGTSRQALIDAFKKRHCYAATDNIFLEVRSGDHIMGDEFTTKKRPNLEITVHGAAPIAKLHIIRDNKYVYSTEPKKAQVKLRYTDMDANKGKTSYYYVRVEQEDGNLAWGSPMWITYKP